MCDRSIGGWGVFKECDFGERMEGEVYPKALTFPVDTLDTTSCWSDS